MKMSGQYARLPDSKRNELIDNYRNGIIDPNYEVIPSKTTTGRYTIRRRKTALPVPENQPQSQQQPEQPVEQPQEEEPPEEEPEEAPYNPYTDDNNYLPQFKMNKNAMFREMQMAMNRMMIENMKMMRQQVKQVEKKRLKLKEKNKKISDLLSSIVEQAEREEQEEQQRPAEPEPAPEETHEEHEEDIQTIDTMTAPQYPNEYEHQLAQMAGDAPIGLSRRSRLHTERFGI